MHLIHTKKQSQISKNCVACYQIQMQIFKCLQMNKVDSCFAVISLFDPLGKETILTVRQSKMCAVRIQIVR